MGFFSKIKDTFFGKSTKQNEKYVAGLDKSHTSFSSKINELAARYRELDDDYFESTEEYSDDSGYSYSYNEYAY